jgi:hypothetical protein
MRRSARTGLGAVLLTAVATLTLVSIPPALASDDEAAEPAYDVGDRIAAFTLETQHGEPASVDAATRILLFSRDMEGGELLKEALDGVTAEDLEERGAAYVSDISGMPSLVARLFALPAMRRRSYVMLLDRDGATTARLPDAPGQATLIHLDALRIERIQHAPDAATIRSSLGLGDADDAAASDRDV